MLYSVGLEELLAQEDEESDEDDTTCTEFFIMSYVTLMVLQLFRLFLQLVLLLSRCARMVVTCGNIQVCSNLAQTETHFRWSLAICWGESEARRLSSHWWCAQHYFSSSGYICASQRTENLPLPHLPAMVDLFNGYPASRLAGSTLQALRQCFCGQVWYNSWTGSFLSCPS